MKYRKRKAVDGAVVHSLDTKKRGVIVLDGKGRRPDRVSIHPTHDSYGYEAKGTSIALAVVIAGSIGILIVLALLFGG